MKRKVLLTSFLLFIFGFLAFRSAERTIAEILKELQFSEASAKDYAWSNISYKQYYNPSPGKLKMLAAAERASIVRTVGNFVKGYTLSQEFAARYKEFVDSRKPEPPQLQPSFDETRVKQKGEIRAAIKNMEESKKSLPAAQQSAFDDIIKSFKVQLADLDKPADVNQKADTDKYISMDNEARRKEYQEKLASWQLESASKPTVLVKIWLEEFLEVSSTVDFSAQLREENGRKYFLNPDFESKPQLWKLCFRAGKETVEAGRIFARTWLNELN